MIEIRDRFKQEGGVSLFLVIFAALLMSIITISFIQLMISDQQQATASDLSQSAYDSAQAGVEDAKRVLLMSQTCGTSTTSLCNRVKTAINSGDCNTVSLALTGVSGGGETMVRQSTSDGAALLQQAYTCVKITPDTNDYAVPGVRANESVIVPLKSKSAFDRVKVGWFSSEDVSGAPTVNLPTFAPDLPRVGAQWTSTMPSILRAQLMQTGPNFDLSDFDDTGNARTLFLYPTSTGLNQFNYNLDGRQSSVMSPQLVRCNTSFVVSTYACTATLLLPNPAGGNAGNRANAFLRLAPLYNNASVQVELFSGGTQVKFDGVQPEIDSTGRANSMFRRVVTRVELNADASYPQAAVDLNGNLCKNFTITDKVGGYSNSCTP